MKTLIIALSLLSINSYALRCGTEIIQEGDSILKVEKYCNLDENYQVKNDFSDIKKVEVPDGGGTSTIEVIDGRVHSIDFNR